MDAGQLAALKADILSRTAFNEARAVGNLGAIADFYNTSVAGDVWRPSVSVAELNTAIVWDEFIALPIAKQLAYQALTAPGFIDATSTNVRSGFVSIFGVGSATLTNLTAVAKRRPTRVEVLFSTGNVSTAFGLVLSPDDIAAALGS